MVGPVSFFQYPPWYFCMIFFPRVPEKIKFERSSYYFLHIEERTHESFFAHRNQFFCHLWSRLTSTSDDPQQNSVFQYFSHIIEESLQTTGIWERWDSACRFKWLTFRSGCVFLCNGLKWGMEMHGTLIYASIHKHSEEGQEPGCVCALQTEPIVCRWAFNGLTM